MDTQKKITITAEVEDNSAQDIMRKYDKESQTRLWEGVPKLVINVFFALLGAFCIYMTLFRSDVLMEVKLSLFIGLMVIAGYLQYPLNKKHVLVNRMPWYDIALMVIGSSCFFYYAVNAFAIIQAARITTVQAIIGVVGILCLVELCRRCVGVPILVIVGALVIYTFYTKFAHGATVEKALRSVLNELFYSTNGIIGTPIRVCYTFIVLFILFGAFLERTGISEFFISFANRLAGWASGGPAKVAVISSALCGMVSGSSVGNTVTTGSVTIPMMKKTGYKPEFAAAVEASASTGGQIMPPIMGAAAFLMAEYMGVPYAQVAVMAILPAVLYFVGIFIAVHLEAKRLNLKGIDKAELPKWSYLCKNFYLLIPLVLLVVLVSTGAKTMQYAASVSILVAFVVGWINRTANALMKNQGEQNTADVIGEATVQSFKAGYEALCAGSKGAITVVVACAMAGIISGCITATGLASILINAIVKLAGNATIIGLVLTMLCCIILGMGVPTTANYCIMASTCAPILISLGFPVVAAHFFVFYFGIVADITPPVALAAYAGSAIAKSNPMKTGVTATKLAIAAFIVPYIFCYNPTMLFENATVWDVVSITITALLGLFSVAAGLNGYLIRPIHPLLRLVLIGGGVAMMIPGLLTDAIGFVVLAGVVVYQYLMKKKAPVDAETVSAEG